MTSHDPTHPLARRIRLALMATGALIALIAAALYVFSLASSAYAPAVRAVFASKAVDVLLGERPQASLLVFARQRFRAKGCSQLTFLVHGAERSGTVSVQLEEIAWNQWKVLDVTPGWSTRATSSCDAAS